MDHTAVANNAAREEANILADKMRVCVHSICVSGILPACCPRRRVIVIPALSWMLNVGLHPHVLPACCSITAFKLVDRYVQCIPRLQGVLPVHVLPCIATLVPQCGGNWARRGRSDVCRTAGTLGRSCCEVSYSFSSC